MAILSHSTFQLPIPRLFHLIPPSHPLQWFIRFHFLLYAIFIAAPIIIPLVIVSVSLCSLPKPLSNLAVFAPLPLHPDNLPPKRRVIDSIWRGVVVYVLGTCIWAIAGIGNAPEPRRGEDETVARWNIKWVEKLKKRSGTQNGSEGWKLDLDEVMVCPPSAESLLGVLKDYGGGSGDIKVLRLKLKCMSQKPTTIQTTRTPSTPTGRRRAILFFTGGGYVTGHPLAHPYIISLVRRLPPATLQDGWTLFASVVRKSLSYDRAFPAPLVDALATYVYLRREGYRAEDIVVVGESAGAGLTWSLMAYLAVLQTKGELDLGIPGGFCLKSPWFALPPFQPPPYPDMVDEPLLLNAARCYLAHFPIPKHRPNPFASDLGFWLEATSRWLHENISYLVRRSPPHEMGESPRKIFLPREKLASWLDSSSFDSLSSHHPFISPSTDPTSPFVSEVLDILAGNGTRLFIHIGTGEWFYQFAMDFAGVAKERDVETVLMEEPGAFHVELELLSTERGSMAGRLIDGILGWLQPSP